MQRVIGVFRCVVGVRALIVEVGIYDAALLIRDGLSEDRLSGCPNLLSFAGTVDVVLWTVSRVGQAGQCLGQQRCIGLPFKKRLPMITTSAQ